MKERKKLLMRDYRARLEVMRNQELKRKEEILIQKAQANAAILVDPEETVPLAMLHLDDHVGSDQVSKLQINGATN